MLNATTSALTSWALNASLNDAYLSGSDTDAVGGDLAYQYAKSGNLSAFSMDPALAILGNVNFGSANQALQLVGVLKDASVFLA